MVNPCAPCCMTGRALSRAHTLGHDPKPYCTGIGCKLDHHEHPARPVQSLEGGQALGKAGLDAIFTVGSLWHYGPIYENMETVVRVLDTQAYNSNGLRDKQLPRRPLSWFIECEVVESPHRSIGYTTGYPPHTLIPRDVVLRERSSAPCCEGRRSCTLMEAKLRTVEHALAAERCQHEATTRELGDTRRRLREAEGSLTKIRAALDSVRGVL